MDAAGATAAPHSAATGRLRPKAAGRPEALRSTAAQVYISAETMLRLAALVEAACRALAARGLRVPPLILPAEVLKVGRTHWMRIDKARAILGYAPRVRPEQGMRSTVDALLQRQREEEARRAAVAPLAAPHWAWWVAIVAGR